MNKSSNNKKLILKLDKFLEKHKTFKNDYTHTSMGGLISAGKFCIETMGEKKKLYRLLDKLKQKSLNASITERPMTYGPIRVDVDLEIPSDSYTEGRLYTEEMIKRVSEIYRNIIKQVFTTNNPELYSVLLEKPNVTHKNSNIKDGFHIIFPNLCVEDKCSHVIRKLVLNNLKETPLFKDFNQDINDIIDRASITHQWLMYSCAKPEREPYILTKVFNHKGKEVKQKKFTKTDLGIIKRLSLQNTVYWDEPNQPLFGKISESDIDDMYQDISPEQNYEENNISYNNEEHTSKCFELVRMYKKNRSDHYHNWIRVGWALYNVSTSLLPLWIEFSKKSKKFKEGECERFWANMKKRNLGYPSIRYWAKEDNLSKFNQFREREIEEYLKKSEGLGTFWIAKALHCKYGEQFICSNPDKNEWYRFENHRWKSSKGGSKLLILLSSEFSDLYRNLSTKHNNLAIKGDKDDKKKHDEKSQEYILIAKKLLDISFKKKIIEEAKNIFYDEKFIDYLDENRDLICFENGVFDLKLNKFRPGRPDDYLSLSTGNTYKKWNPKTPIAGDILKFFNEILPNKDVREYFLKVLSTCVSGENKEEKFYLETGEGSNGKSVTFELIKYALGDYYIACPITILTGKRGSSGAASPELARLKGRRIGVFSEPGNNENFDVGMLKELTGNDSITARHLHQDMIEFKPQVKLFLQCNELPAVKTSDGDKGTWRRIRVIKFNSKFVEEHDMKDDPNYFLIDKTLKHKLKDWGIYFIRYLIHLYVNEYSKNGINEPKEVMEATNTYKKRNDRMADFYLSKFTETNNTDDYITKSTIWGTFKDWWQEFYNHSKRPGTSELYDYINKRRKIKKSGWCGIKYKCDDNEEKKDTDSDDETNNNKCLDV